ncbi:hypothetical protein [Pyruvatibacter sp.]|uniref:hypothetical protein n=1 Tax=Pyruvatibacter sp. TaxID=1981328 RepID=UPI003265FEDB
MADIFSSKGAGLFQQRSPIDFFQARKDGGSDDVSAKLIATLKKAGASNIDALEKKRAENKETQLQLESLKRQSDPSEARKARAQEKIDQIKKQLEALRMLANIDPEAAARQAARLSRELASAVREYASAGGDTGALTGASGSTASPGAQSSAGSEAASGDAAPASTNALAGQSGSASDTATGQSASEKPEASATGTSATAEQHGAAPAESEASAATSDETSRDSDGVEDTHPDRERAEAFQQLFAEREGQDAEGRGEREFVDEIKKLKRELERLIEGGSDEAQNHAEERELEKGLHALKDVDHALVAMSSPISASLGAINIIA